MKLKKQFAASLAVLLTASAAAFSAESPQARAAQPAVCAAYADAGKTVVSGGVYEIMVRLNGKYLTAASDGNVQQWEALGTDAQQWKIVKVGDSCAILSAADESLAMTVEGGDNTNGNNIALSAYTGSDAQLFTLFTADDAFYIRAKCSSSAALDVYDISYENGANIDQWDYWAGEGQKFYFKPAGGKLEFLRGDLDFNGKINAEDFTLMKRGMLYGFDSICTAIADVEAPEQGSADMDDVHAMQDYLLNKRSFSSAVCEISAEEEAPFAYLFAYFLGNAPEQERLSYAVSLDGYHFNALNGGNAVWQSSVGTKCLRDPYIFKGEDGLWHLLG